MILCLLYLSMRGDGGRLLGAAVLAAGCGIYLFLRGFRTLQRKRLIENTPTSKIRSAALGLVEVCGLASGPYTISAPITGLPCYYYRSIAWQLKKSGKNDHWEKVADDSLHVPFYLDDNTARLLVDPQGAEMDIHRDFSETYSNSIFSGTLGVPANVGNFLARHGVDCDKKIKIEEFCIKPKNALFILGTLSQNHGVSVSDTPVRSLAAEAPKFSINRPIAFERVSSGSPASVGRVPLNAPSNPGIGLSRAEISDEFSGMTQQARLAAALLKAGISNPAAWAVAGVSDRVTAVASGGGAAAVGPAPEPFDFHPPVVLMKGVHDPAFFISWRSRREVVESLGWKSAAMIWGGPLLTMLSGYFISAYFGWL